LNGVNAISTTVVALVCVFASAMCGIRLRLRLPPEHLSEDSKDILKLSLGLVSTMVALILGLLVSSSRDFYDTQTAEVTQVSAQVIWLDRTLALYGSETKEAREALRANVASALDQIWSEGRAPGSEWDTQIAGPEHTYDLIQRLQPKNDAQRAMRDQALTAVTTLGHTRWLMYQQLVTPIPQALVVVLVAWLSVTFLGFGVFAPSNSTAIGSLFVAALSVSGALLLILEMHSPYQGLIRISSGPLRAALEQLGR